MDRVNEVYYGKLYSAATQNALKDRIHWMVGHATGSKVLDVGCSQGITSILLARGGFNVTGVDINPDSIDYARNEVLLEEDNVLRKISLICADIFDLALEDRFYDTIIIGEFLEHIEKPEELLKRITKFAKENARILITVPFGLLDHPDHKKTYYISSLLDILPECIAIDDITIIGKRICLSCSLTDDPGAVKGTDEKGLLRISEDEFYRLERNYLDKNTALKNKNTVLQKKIEHLSSELDGLKEDNSRLNNICNQNELKLNDYSREILRIKNSIRYKLGNAIVKAIRPSKYTLLLPYEIIKLILRKLKKQIKLFKTVKAINVSIPDNISIVELKELYLKSKKNKRKITIGKYLYKRLKDIGSISEGLNVLNEIKKLNGTSDFIEREIQISLDKLELLANDQYNPQKRGEEAIAEGSTRDNWPAQSLQTKVLHILNTSIPYLKNGYSIRSKYIIENQKALGIIPVVLTRPGFPNDFVPGTINNKKVLFFEEIEGIKYYRCLPALFMRHTPLMKYLNCFADQICNVAEIEKPDIIQSASNYVIGLAGLSAARRLKLPFVYEIRGFWELTTVSKEPLFKDSEEYNMQRKMETFLAHQADKVIVISQGLKNDLIQRGINGGKITIIPNGVDCRQFYPTPYNNEIEKKYNLKDKFVIGYIGSIVKYEGLQFMLEVMSILKQGSYKEVTFMVVGDGDYLEELKAKAAEAELNDCIIFTGRVSHDEVNKYYSVFDLCVYPRVNEDVTNIVTPLKPLEAMACGKIVAGSSVDALKEIIIHDVNGFLFNDKEELYNLIIDLMCSKGKNITLQKETIEWVNKNRSWDKIVTSYKSVYNFK